jgi:hypothetical protein
VPHERSIVIGETTCRRCNARSVVRAHHRGRGDTLLVSNDCPKCKLSFALGFVSEREIRRRERHAELMKEFPTASPARKGAIIKAVGKLAEEEEEWLQSL